MTFICSGRAKMGGSAFSLTCKAFLSVPQTVTMTTFTDRTMEKKQQPSAGTTRTQMMSSKKRNEKVTKRENKKLEPQISS